MGYIVGRNSAATGADLASTPRVEPPQTAQETRAREPEPARSETPKDEIAKVETAAQQPSEEKTAPARVAEETRTTSKSEPSRSEALKAEPRRPEKGSKRVPNQPEPGKAYLQLAATSRHEADIMVDVLRKKGFKSMSSEIEEKAGTFRVLVGPLADGGTNKMRVDLQSAGFPGNAAIRRTF